MLIPVIKSDGMTMAMTIMQNREREWRKIWY